MCVTYREFSTHNLCLRYQMDLSFVENPSGGLDSMFVAPNEHGLSLTTGADAAPLCPVALPLTRTEIDQLIDDGSKATPSELESILNVVGDKSTIAFLILAACPPSSSRNIVTSSDDISHLSRSSITSFEGRMQYDRWCNGGEKGLHIAANKWLQKKGFQKNLIDKAVISFIIGNEKKVEQKVEKVPSGFEKCDFPGNSNHVHYYVDGNPIPFHDSRRLKEYLRNCPEEEVDSISPNASRLFGFDVCDSLIPHKSNGSPHRVRACYAVCRFWRMVYAGLIPCWEIFDLLITQQLLTEGNKGAVNEDIVNAQSNSDFADSRFKGPIPYWFPPETARRIVEVQGMSVEDYDDYMEEGVGCYSTTEDSCPVTIEEVVPMEIVEEVVPMEVEESYAQEIIELFSREDVFPVSYDVPSLCVAREVVSCEDLCSPAFSIPQPLEEAHFHVSSTSLPFEDGEESYHFLSDSECEVENYSFEELLEQPREVIWEDPAIVQVNVKPRLSEEVLGTAIYYRILDRVGKDFAGKVTGMLLEQGIDRCAIYLDSPSELWCEVSEAMRILEDCNWLAEKNKQAVAAHVSFIDPAIMAIQEAGMKPRYFCTDRDFQEKFEFMVGTLFTSFMDQIPQSSLPSKLTVPFSQCDCNACKTSFLHTSPKCAYRPCPVDLTVCGDVEKNPGPDDNAPIETESSVVSHSNVTFVDERPVEAESQLLGASSSMRDPNMDMADNPWNMRSILTKEIKIASQAWSESKSYGDVLFEGSIPQIMWLNPSHTRSQLKLYAFFRSGFEFRVQLNGTKFHCGRILVVIVPPMWEADSKYYSFRSYVLFPHFWLDASLSNSGVITVPFSHCLSYFPLEGQRQENPEMATLGRLRLIVFNPLRVADGASTNLSYTIYGRFTPDLEFHQPTSEIQHFVESKGFFHFTGTTQAGKSQGEGLWKSTLARIVGGVATTFLNTMTGGLASGVGTALAGLIFDKPSDPLEPSPVIVRSADVLCHGAGIDHSTRLSLLQISQTETVAAQVGGSVTDYNLRNLLSLPSSLETIVWNTSHPPETNLIAIPITPVYIPDGEVVTHLPSHVTYNPTMLAYISRAFVYWRGSLRFKFQVVSTQYHSGRLLISFDPVAMQKFPSMEDSLQRNFVVVDIEEQQEFEVNVPFMSLRPWLRCDSFRSDKNFKDTVTPPRAYLGQGHTGYLYVYVMNLLVCPSNVSQSVDVNVFVSAGPDFELAIPNSLSPLSVTKEDYPKYGGFQPYPFVRKDVKNTWPLEFQNKEFITELYWHGLRLFAAKAIKERKDLTIWFACEPATDMIRYEVSTWLMQVKMMAQYVGQGPDSLPQAKWMSQFTDYSKVNFVQAGSAEEFLTTREDAIAPIEICAGHRSMEVAPTTVSEDAMNMQTILRRMYPVMIHDPIYSAGGFTVITIPVSPTFCPQKRFPVRGAYGEIVPVNQIGWFSRLYTYWRGSLRFLLTYGPDSVEAYVYYTPHVVYPHSVIHGMLSSELQTHLSFAAVVGVTRLQGSLQFEIPFQSAYNQLLLDHHQKAIDLRAINGTAWIAIRPRTTAAPVSGIPLSLFMSTGEDFVMNILKAPPSVSELMTYFADCKEDKDYYLRTLTPELERDIGDESRKYATPSFTGFNYLDPLLKPWYCDVEYPPGGKPTEKGKTNKDLLQLAGDVEKNPGPNMSKIFFPEDLREDIKQTTAVVRSAFTGAQESCLPAATAALTRLDDLISSVQDRMESLAPTKESISKYVLLSSQVVTAGAVLHCIRNCLNDPCLSTFISLGVSMAALVGLVASESIKGIITSVVNWVLSVPETTLGQTQALDGPVADWVSLNESHILSVTAVIGVVIYAFLFDVVPSFSTIKAKLKAFFEDDEVVEEVKKGKGKAQAGLAVTGLRNSHFAMLGLTSLEKVYTKIMDLVQKFIDWLLERDDPNAIAARHAEQHSARIMAVVKELDTLEDEHQVLSALSEINVHNRFYHLAQEVYDLTDICVKEKLDSRVCVLITECRRRISKLLERLKAYQPPVGSMRYDPFVICLTGSPGTGKTRLMTSVLTKLVQEELGLVDYNLTYTKNIVDQYWSGYTGQPIVLWDEFAQNKELDEVVPEFMSLRGNAPVTLNMADLQSKGRHFSSKVILMTTNSPHVEFNSVRENDAFKRRRNLMFGFQLAPGHTTDSMDDAGFNDFPNWEHCVIRQLDPLARTDVFIGDVLSLDDVKYIIRTKLREWNIKQERIIMANSDENVIPPGIHPVVLDDDGNLMRRAIAGDEELGFADFEEENPLANLVPLGRVQAGTAHCVDLYVDDSVEQSVRLRAQLWLNNWYTMSPERRKDIIRNRVLIPAKRKTDSLLNIAKNVFIELKNSIYQFITSHPRLATVIGIIALLSSCAAVAYAFKADPGGVPEPNLIAERIAQVESAYDNGVPRRLAVKNVKAEGSYNYEIPRLRVKNVTQGTEDPVGNDIATKIHPFVYIICWITGDSKWCMRCFHVKGHLILLPRHFFNGARPGDRFALFHRTKDVLIEYDPSRMYGIDKRDWVIYNCGPRLDPAKYNFKYFISERDLARVGKIPGILLGVSPQLTQQAKYGMVEPVRKFEYYDVKYGETYSQKGWAFAYPTQDGECGSLLIGLHTSVVAPGKILGVHTAGIPGKNWGFSTLVLREEVEQMCEKAGFQVNGVPTIQGALDFDPSVARVIPQGDYTMCGIMPNKKCVAQPIKTSLVQTPFHNSLPLPPPKVPAFLMPFHNTAGERISPLRLALEKYGNPTVPFPWRNITKVKKHVSAILKQKLTRHTGKRIFTKQEAVLGIEGIPFAERLNFKSSAGWPYQVLEKTKPGKWHLFDDEGNIVDPLCSHMVSERISKAENGDRVCSLWRDCLKDELRPYEKAMAGKTRLFTIGPVDYTICVRMYFMDFVVAFYTHALEFFSAVGVNPESFEWTRLHDHLASISSSSIAGDFKRFDGTLHPELIMAVCEIINEWYDDSLPNQNVRTTLFTELVHTLQLVENLIYMTHQGNPSGNPLTVILNTIICYMYLCLAWLEICPSHTLDDFSRLVHVFTYGDDSLATVSYKVPHYNFNTIRVVLLKYGIELTSDAKDIVAPDFTPLSDCTFLKRGFRKDESFGKSLVLPTMSVDTLRAFFYYYRKAPNEEDQLQENMRAALGFAFFHGEEFYNSYLEKWNSLLSTCGYAPVFISFEEQLDVFLSVCSMSGKTSESQHFKSLLNTVEGSEATFGNSHSARLFASVLEAPLYYLLAPFGGKKSQENFQRSDPRWAAAIPSGEGKSYLAKKYPHVFVDHDELLLPAFNKTSKKQMLKEGIPWSKANARSFDFPIEDKRILLVHHPDNTKRQIVGSFITHYPSFIRANVIQRLRLNHPVKLDKESRNLFLLEFARSHIPELFHS